MPSLTQDQALQIARSFARFASTVENYRFDRYDNLTELQEGRHRSVEQSLRTTSNSFLDLGINLSLGNVQGALDSLGQITTTLNEDLAHLNDVNKALQVVGVLVQLGTAFATANPEAIASALKASVDTLTAA